MSPQVSAHRHTVRARQILCNLLRLMSKKSRIKCLQTRHLTAHTLWSPIRRSRNDAGNVPRALPVSFAAPRVGALQPRRLQGRLPCAGALHALSKLADWDIMRGYSRMWKSFHSNNLSRKLIMAKRHLPRSMLGLLHARRRGKPIKKSQNLLRHCQPSSGTSRKSLTMTLARRISATCSD